MAHPNASANPNDFILPDLGEGVHEAELIAWRVEVGQTVAEHDILAEMETDKARVEVPSPRAGTIAALHGQPGQILKVGNPLVSYQPSGAGVPPVSQPASPSPHPTPETRPPKPAAQRAANNGRASAQPQDESLSEPSPDREDAGTVVGNMAAAAGGVTAAPGKALATPAVRRLARDLGIDINTIQGTGIAGRITEKDVRGAASGTEPGAPARTPAPRAGRTGIPDVAPMDLEEPHSAVVDAPSSLRRATASPAGRATGSPAAGGVGGQAVPPPSVAPSPGGRRSVASHPEAPTRLPFRGVRRTIANRLRQSIDQAVHFTVMDEADVSALDALRRKLAAASGEKLSFLPFVAGALARVLTTDAFRALNATVDEKPDDPNHEPSIIQHRAVHLGIATDTDSGLMVPVVRDADALGVLEIARHIAHAAESARNRSAPREALTGSTFTISNVGSHAGRFATPVINYPEVGILAVGRARQAPVVRSGGLFVGNLLPLSLACDHRVVDGATAALALAEVIRLLQEPEGLMGPARG